jgi:hypothetical protein
LAGVDSPGARATISQNAARQRTEVAKSTNMDQESCRPQRVAESGMNETGVTMKYMLLIYSAETAITPDQYSDCIAKSTKLCQDLAERGQFLAASPLQPVATATCVRIRNGARLITDGPFAETTEQLGGYYLIEATDLDEAIAVASRIPPATWGTVEIRPVVEVSGLPTAK